VLHGQHAVGALVEGLEEDGRQRRLGKVPGLVEEAHRPGILHRPTRDHDFPL